MEIFNNKQAQQYIKLQPIFIADTDNYYILDKIMRGDHIECRSQINNDKN